MSLYDVIKEVPMFNRFTEKEKKIFSEMDHSILGFNEGDPIINEGDTYSSIYLLVKGTVLVTKTGMGPALTELESGAIFGEMSFFTKKPRHSNVIASSRVTVVKMDNNFFKKVTPEIRDKIKNYFIEELINRLDTMNESLFKISRFARGSVQM